MTRVVDGRLYNNSGTAVMVDGTWYTTDGTQVLVGDVWVPRTPPPAPRRTSDLAVFGVLSFLLGCVGMAVGVGTGQGQIVVVLGLPFLVFVAIWSHKHPAQAAVLATGLAVYNHESNVRHERRMADLNARLGPPVVTRPQPWLTVAQASGQPTFQMGTTQGPPHPPLVDGRVVTR